MFSHIVLGTNNPAAAKKFYDAALGALGHGPGVERPETGQVFLGHVLFVAIGCFPHFTVARLAKADPPAQRVTLLLQIFPEPFTPWHFALHGLSTKHSPGVAAAAMGARERYPSTRFHAAFAACFAVRSVEADGWRVCRLQFQRKKWD